MSVLGTLPRLRNQSVDRPHHEELLQGLVQSVDRLHQEELLQGLSQSVVSFIDCTTKSCPWVLFSWSPSPCILAKNTLNYVALLATESDIICSI